MPPLTPREAQILTLLSEGHTYEDVCTALRVSPASLHVHARNIRQKTGVQSTRNAGACLAYLLRAKPPTPPQPSPAQREVLRMIAEGKSYPQICGALGISKATAMNHVCQGCKRLGVTARGVSRMIELREALERESAGAVTMDDPFFN